MATIPLKRGTNTPKVRLSIPNKVLTGGTFSMKVTPTPNSDRTIGMTASGAIRALTSTSISVS